MTARGSDRALTLPQPVPGTIRGHARQPILRVLPGTPDSVHTARLMARQLLGDGDPAAETVVLLVSELVTNAIVHSQSGAPGGTVTVTLCPVPAGVLVQVRDDGGPSEPCLTGPCLAELGTGGAEHGYGLLLVDALADRWGTISGPGSRVTWCRITRHPGAEERAETEV